MIYVCVVFVDFIISKEKEVINNNIVQQGVETSLIILKGKCHSVVLSHEKAVSKEKKCT